MATRFDLRYAATLMLLATSAALHAQSPRMMVIEEATNASCGPCAAQNPYFEAYLALEHNRTDIIPLVYHANWPGQDVMNAASPTMHNTRVQYYGISGVPTAVVNGTYQGAPSDTASLYNAAKNARGSISPITISVVQTQTGNEVSAQIDVSTAEALSGTKIRILAVEGHHNYTSPPAGFNGEKDFYYTVRQMFPSAQGYDLTLQAGESKSFTESFTIDPSWNADQMYVVAFVQRESNREILQAGTSRGQVTVQSDVKPSVVQKTQEEPGEWNTEVKASFAGEYSVQIEKDLPSGWTADVTIGGNPVTADATVALDDETTLPMQIHITPSSSSDKKGVGEVTVNVTGDHATEFSKTFRLYSSDIQALVFQRDEGRPEIAQYYNEALSRGDVVYALVDPQDESQFDYHDYPVIVYEVGKWALTASDVTTMKNYMDQGGRLFLIGAEIAYGLADPQNTDPLTPRDLPFLQDYLHADYTADAASSFTVKGIAGDPIGDGLSFSINTGVQNQDTPDQLAARVGAVPILYYGSSQSAVAGLRYADSKTRLVYFGFGVEGIGTVAQRAEVMKRSIAWLMGTETTSGLENEPLGGGTLLGTVSPNPVRDQFEALLRLDRRAQVTATLYSVTGQRVARIADGAFEAGTRTIRCDVSGLAAGLYNLVVTVDGQTSARTVTVVR